MSTDHAEEEEDDLDWADDGVDDEAAAVVADHPLLDAPQQLAQRVVGVLLGECLPPEGVTLVQNCVRNVLSFLPAAGGEEQAQGHSPGVGVGGEDGGGGAGVLQHGVQGQPRHLHGGCCRHQVSTDR